MWTDIRFGLCIAGMFCNTWLFVVSPHSRGLAVTCIACFAVGALLSLGGPDDGEKGDP